MPVPFHSLSVSQFDDVLSRVEVRRTITALHVDPISRPSRLEFDGAASLLALKEFHSSLGWRDIAHHMIVAPDRLVYVGRSWELPPEGAPGHDGNEHAGPLLIGWIGSADPADDLEGTQRSDVVQLLARLLHKFKLTPDAIHPRAKISGRGTSSPAPGELVALRKEVAQALKRMVANSARGEETAPGNVDPPFSREYEEEHQKLREVLAAMTRMPHDRDRAAAPAGYDARAQQFFDNFRGTAAAPARAGQARGRSTFELGPAGRKRLRPHVINLEQGAVAEQSEHFPMDEQDLEAIFKEHLPLAADAAQGRGQALRILFYAHGGLTDEIAGLRMAAGQIPWWISNDIYPIHFVWQTGLLETIVQLLAGSREVQLEAQRGLADVADRVVEEAARRLGAKTLWSGMKRNAELASAAGGAARRAAQLLGTFCKGRNVELHAIGHSAGLIFHSHFLPAAKQHGVPNFKSLHLLAPAIRIELFEDQLGQMLGNGVDYARIYTMAKDWELADDSLVVYHKSLLYLVSLALEDKRGAAILGLEESLRSNQKARQWFGLDGQTSNLGEVIWSVSKQTGGRNASQSQTHGCFDNDAATMHSVARFILGRDQVNHFPEALTAECAHASRELIARHRGARLAAAEDLQQPIRPAGRVASTFRHDRGPGGGRRRALCVGINDYPNQPLQGCVADSQSWASTLVALGFEQPTMLHNADATRTAILRELRSLLSSSNPGDVLVFQFSGHGTQLPDLDGDEKTQDTAEDEALCPYDFETGHFIIDDDLREVFADIPTGVNVTCFMDCCHSGTISRLVVGTPLSGVANELPRFITATKPMQQAHLEFRSELGLVGRAVPRSPEGMREVLFAACLSREVAWESAGQGEFTVRATQVLGTSGGSLTNEEFQRRVTNSFGQQPRQHPDLDCAPAVRGERLLSTPIGHGESSRPSESPAQPGESHRRLAEALRGVADALDEA